MVRIDWARATGPVYIPVFKLDHDKVDLCAKVNIVEGKCSRLLEEAKAKGAQYHQLLQEVEGESNWLGACFQDVVKWTVAKDCLEVDKFWYWTM